MQATAFVADSGPRETPLVRKDGTQWWVLKVHREVGPTLGKWSYCVVGRSGPTVCWQHRHHHDKAKVQRHHHCTLRGRQAIPFQILVEGRVPAGMGSRGPCN